MRALAGLLVLVALLTACGAPFADGRLPAPSGAPVAANANAATATRGTPTCIDGAQLVGDPDRSGGRWRVFVMRDTSVSLELQEIVAVWY